MAVEAVSERSFVAVTIAECHHYQTPAAAKSTRSHRPAAGAARGVVLQNKWGVD